TATISLRFRFLRNSGLSILINLVATLNGFSSEAVPTIRSKSNYCLPFHDLIHSFSRNVDWSSPSIDVFFLILS
ncbi:uncharacterized protein EV420DRAFT_1576113, partial [Desarmillaria tabescens]